MNHKLDSSKVRIVELTFEVNRLRHGIQNILDGNYPHPRTYRPHSCPHGVAYWEECEQCNSDALSKLLDAGLKDTVA
jgi:hypothetical protein